MILVDVNVYIALFLATHPFHEQAFASYPAARQRTTAHNAVILSETHHVLRRLAGLETAGRALRTMLADDELAPMNAEVVERGLELAEAHRLSTNDALIAAHALEERMELLTFDADFRRVRGLRLFGKV